MEFTLYGVTKADALVIMQNVVTPILADFGVNSPEISVDLRPALLRLNGAGHEKPEADGRMLRVPIFELTLNDGDAQALVDELSARLPFPVYGLEARIAASLEGEPL